MIIGIVENRLTRLRFWSNFEAGQGMSIILSAYPAIAIHAPKKVTCHRYVKATHVPIKYMNENFIDLNYYHPIK